MVGSFGIGCSKKNNKQIDGYQKSTTFVVRIINGLHRKEVIAESLNKFKCHVSMCRMCHCFILVRERNWYWGEGGKWTSEQVRLPSKTVWINVEKNFIIIFQYFFPHTYFVHGISSCSNEIQIYCTISFSAFASSSLISHKMSNRIREKKICGGKRGEKGKEEA